MRRYLLLTVLGVLVGSTLMAQREFKGRSVRLGFKIDPVFSNTLKPFENGVQKDGSRFGVNYGLMADVMFSDGRGAFATGLEVVHASGSLLYKDNNKGLYRAEAAGAEQKYTVKLQYLQIPISVKLKTNENNGFRWWGQFGTYMGALLGSRLDYSYGSKSEDNIKIMNKTNKVNLGLLLGAGGEYRVAEKTDLYFGLGFENGFTDITSNKDWKDGKVALNRWALRLGVFF